MHLIKVLIIWYLIIGLLCGLEVIGWFIFKEWVEGKPDVKFGPAHKSWFTYIAAFCVACPILNIIVGYRLIVSEAFVRKSCK